MNTRGSRAFVMATATDDPRSAGPRPQKMPQEYLQTAERSTTSMGESSPNSKPKSAVVMHVGKLSKPRRKVGRPCKKPVTVALQEERPGPSTNDSESKAGT